MKSQCVAIMGLGAEGVASANYFKDKARIVIYDDKNKDEIDNNLLSQLRADADFYFNKKIDQKVDLIIRSPAVKVSHPQITRLIKKGAVLSSSTKFFFENCPAKIIGVSGTKGKGTTSTLIYKILKTTTDNVFLAGNIGTPAIEILPKVNKKSLVVLELSSFQLIDLQKSPHIAVVLMITSEHLDWHSNQLDYWHAKLPIVKFQKASDFAIINQDFPISKGFQKYTKAKTYFFSTKSQTNGISIQKNEIISNINGLEKITSVDKIKLPGSHNLQNVLSAISVAKILKVDNTNIVKVLSNFKGLQNRLHLVRKIREVSYYNDSYSTIPETAIAAIAAFQEPKILIIGGSSKNSNFENLAETIIQSGSIKALILIGQEASKIKKTIYSHGNFRGQIIENLKTVGQIVKKASEIAQEGDIVILSPACASFDMFKNYKDRGEQFVKTVRNLK